MYLMNSFVNKSSKKPPVWSRLEWNTITLHALLGSSSDKKFVLERNRGHNSFDVFFLPISFYFSTIFPEEIFVFLKNVEWKEVFWYKSDVWKTKVFCEQYSAEFYEKLGGASYMMDFLTICRPHLS